MTVKELIDALQAFEENAEVYTDDNFGGLNRAWEVEESSGNIVIIS